MNIALKNSLKKSSLTVATFTLFIIVNVNVVSANRLKNYENNIQLGSSKSIDGSTKIGYQELHTRVDDDSQIQKNSVQTQDESTVVKSGKWGADGPEWSYDPSNNTLKVGAGTIKGADNGAGAFADPDILKNVKRIQFDQHLKLVGDFGYWFRYVKDERLINLTEISGLSNIDTSEVTSMRGMFYASKIKSLDLSSWVTSAVTDMSYMFTDMFIDSDDGSLNIGGNFASNAKNVKDMTFMFNGCANLTKIDGVKDLNTSSVTSMKNMFHGDYNLTELDLSHFNTEKVTNMADMLSYLISLNYLDLSSFDTTQSPNMKNMLAYDLTLPVGTIVNGKVVYQYAPGITTLVLGTKTKLSTDVALGQPNPEKTPNKENFINKWRLTNNNSEPQLTTAELIQKSQDGSLKPGAYTWKKLVTPPDDTDNNYPAPNPVPVEPTNPVENNDENKDKDESNNNGSSSEKTVVLMHNAYLYDNTGTRANQIILKIGSKLMTYGKTTINGRNFYVLNGKGNSKINYYIAAGNVDSIVRKIKHNAYIYNQYGDRQNKKVLKKGSTTKAYGDPIKIKNKKYYIVDKNRFVKKANF
ncbi:BspA family leucine-rich repeat surface protein [Lactobacillus sp. M0396]|uniref:BspA family leucine-rich repeat surface protein n=1 Tax=Lactobacillus sp. M0396 TaxID=2751030 RepID=UPI0018DE3F7F|nr:BspA family leucine-rich repeat surface protein [Lactobacillus sp. M0396]MBI0033815.1 BspA family leucine-rich repeat surface protein [Lactobacillus sp. M0396]